MLSCPVCTDAGRPGLHDIIRGLVRKPDNHYGVSRVVGFRNGYQGFVAPYRHDVVVIGGEGTLRGAMWIASVIGEREAASAW